jgi:hypothetical protein
MAENKTKTDQQAAATADARTALSTGAPAPTAEVVAERMNRLAQPRGEVAREVGGKYIVLHDGVQTWRQGDEVDFEDLDDKQVKRLLDLGAIAERSKLSLDQQVFLRDRGIVLDEA